MKYLTVIEVAMLRVEVEVLKYSLPKYGGAPI